VINMPSPACGRENQYILPRLRGRKNQYAVPGLRERKSIYTPLLAGEGREGATDYSGDSGSRASLSSRSGATGEPRSFAFSYQVCADATSGVIPPLGFNLLSTSGS